MDSLFEMLRSMDPAAAAAAAGAAGAAGISLDPGAAKRAGKAQAADMASMQEHAKKLWAHLDELSSNGAPPFRARCLRRCWVG